MREYSMVEKEVPKPKKEQSAQNGPKPPANDFSRAKKNMESFSEEKILKAKDGSLVKPPTIDDKLTNKLLMEGTYSNYRFYHDRKTVERSFNPDSWPETLKKSLEKEQEALDLVVERMFGKMAAEAAILDCGCGTGRHLPWAVDKFETVLGMDFSNIVLEIAGEHIAYEKGGMGANKTRLIQGDVSEILGIPSHSLDIAICMFNTLGIIDAHRHTEIMAEVNRVLKAPSLGAPSMFVFSVYMDNEKTIEMQKELYHNFGLSVENTNLVEGGRHYTVARNNAGILMKSQRFTLDYIKRMLDGKFGILIFKQFSETMAYIVAVPIKDPKVTGKLLLEAVEAGKIKETLILLVGGAPTEKEDGFGNTPLCIAAKNGQEILVKWLTIFKADVNHKNKHGDTPLILATGGEVKNATSRNGDTLWRRLGGTGGMEMMKELLKTGAKVDAVNEDHIDALGVACRVGDEQKVRLLIRAGAEVSGGTCTYIDEDEDDKELLARFLLDHLGEPERIPPIIIAAENGKKDIVNLLVDLGADPSETDFDGENALMKAIKQRSSVTAKVLLRGLLSSNTWIKKEELTKVFNNEIEISRTPPIVRQLLQANRDRKTAFMLAKEKGMHEIVTHLEQIGVKE